jgi:hypothetical protein
MPPFASHGSPSGWDLKRFGADRRQHAKHPSHHAALSSYSPGADCLEFTSEAAPQADEFSDIERLGHQLRNMLGSHSMKSWTFWICVFSEMNSNAEAST